MEREPALLGTANPEPHGGFGEGVAGATLATLKGLDAAPAAQGKFFWNPVLRRGFFIARGLPQTPADKAYELWGITGNEPVAVGIFTVDEKGQARINMPPLAQEKSFDKFAVTIEPAPGVVKPTGPMVLLGNV